MATATKTPRLLAAAKEFNIGKETLVEFLTGKGFEINASNPNTKLTEQMYDALQAEFAQDKAAKRKSEEIALPKGSLLDSLKKNKEDLDINKKDEPEAPKVEKKKEEKKEEPWSPPCLRSDLRRHRFGQFPFSGRSLSAQNRSPPLRALPPL